MDRSINQLSGIAVIVVLCVAGAAGSHADRDFTVVASGKLNGRFLAASLFHIDEFWMKVAGGTEFHRWLSQGLDRDVVIRVMADATTLGDEKNTRILTGTLMHEVAARVTPNSTDVVGRMPEGDSGFVHVFFVRDEIAGTGALSAITFESADLATVAKFTAYEGSHVNIVIEIH